MIRENVQHPLVPDIRLGLKVRPISRNGGNEKRTYAAQHLEERRLPLHVGGNLKSLKH
jgi:hypothetical protein